MNSLKMLAVLIFAGSFLFLFGITLVVPSLPPGEMIYTFLGIPEIASPIPNITGEILVKGTINGLFFGVIISIISIFLMGPSKEKVILPAHVPGYATSHMSNCDYVPPKKNTKMVFPRVRKRRLRSPLDQKVVAIEGIGPTYGKRLRNCGVWTIDDLLKEGKTKIGRYHLAREVGVSPSTILKWVNRADFFRINGIWQ